MGAMLSSPANPPKKCTSDERKHLILLGTIAGSPDIVQEAVKSGNIFNPAHMERAKAMAAEWEAGMAVLQPILGRKARTQAKLDDLQCLGLTLDGKPSPIKYDDVEAALAHIKPSDGWKLRVHVGDRVVDLELGNTTDNLSDMFCDVATILPRGSYSTWIVRGEDEPEKLEIETVQSRFNLRTVRE